MPLFVYVWSLVILNKPDIFTGYKEKSAGAGKSLYCKWDLDVMLALDTLLYLFYFFYLCIFLTAFHSNTDNHLLAKILLCALCSRRHIRIWLKCLICRLSYLKRQYFWVVRPDSRTQAARSWKWMHERCQRLKIFSHCNDHTKWHCLDSKASWPHRTVFSRAPILHSVHLHFPSHCLSHFNFAVPGVTIILCVKLQQYFLWHLTQCTFF